MTPKLKINEVLNEASQQRLLRKVMPHLVRWFQNFFSEDKNELLKIEGKKPWSVFFKECRTSPHNFVLRHGIDTMTDEMFHGVHMKIEFEVMNRTP